MTDDKLDLSSGPQPSKPRPDFFFNKESLDDKVVELIVSDFVVDYAGCGSHQMRIRTVMHKEDIDTFVANYYDPPED